MKRANSKADYLTKQRQIDKLVEDAWLLSEEDLVDIKKQGLNYLINKEESIIPIDVSDSPFINRSEEDIEHPELHLIKIIRNPNYFYFTCDKIFNIRLMPFQLAILQELWHRKFPMLIGSRGLSKSFLLALYAMLRALIFQGSKIIIAGSGFRQAKVVFDYCEYMWSNAPVLRNLVGTTGRSGRRNGPRRDVDRVEMVLGDSIIIGLPIGTGEKIRGQRAHYIICDEFASQVEEIYENVISGFAAVSASPAEEARREAGRKLLDALGLGDVLRAKTEGSNSGNQSIISGTAYYDFNHFAKYWRRYKAIIESRGDEKKLQEIFEGRVETKCNWKDYSIIRIPYEMLPPKFMDEATVSRFRATAHSGMYNMEYGAIFTKDSEGFFKRTLIESCVTKKPIQLASGESVQFTSCIRGVRGLKYVYGVDPASEVDKFSIVILELHNNHRRVVYVWTTTREEFRKKVQLGYAEDQDFYGYCALKLRQLLPLFPPEEIAMDAQGGGVQIGEALRNPKTLKDGELPILEIVDPEEFKETDNIQGHHILRLCQFAKTDWVSDANHGLRYDMESKILLFPYEDPIQIELAFQDDLRFDRKFDTLEDAIYEINQLKDELATIEHKQTPGSDRDKWDTPEVKKPGQKKGRLRKDRYSALLMANKSARDLTKEIVIPVYKPVGGFATTLIDIAREAPKSRDGMYIGGNTPEGSKFVHGIKFAPMSYTAVPRRRV